MKRSYLSSKILMLAVLFTAGWAFNSLAQGCYSTSGCSNYSNFGYNSTTAGALEYDNYVSGFHSTVVRDIDGTLKIWGEMTQANGHSSYLMPTPINAGNYPTLTGTPLKVGIASGSINNVQFVLLTDDNKLWTWGVAGVLFAPSLTTNTNVVVAGVTKSIAAFQQLSIGLPTGVTASNVKMMFATHNSLLITTCDGEVFSLVQYWGNTGTGNTSAINVWNKVMKSATAGGGSLTGIVAARGCSGGFVALDTLGNLWTWGAKTWNGVDAPTQRNTAVQITLPSQTANIKMIGMTGTSGGTGTSSVYVLYQNGNLYAIGDNNLRQLGNWTTTNSQTWVQPRYDSVAGPIMDDVKWISPQEHDVNFRSINVLNDDKKIFNWGQEDKSNLGRGVSGCNSPTAALDPGEPTAFTVGYSNSSIVSVETGGHTSMALRECESDFGYVGHRINGSMGDNNNADECDNEFQFATSAIEVCGAIVVDAVVNSSVEGPYYVGNSVTLLGSPSGGTYSISTLSTATATLTDSVLLFTGIGTLRVDYAVQAGTCGLVTVSKTFNVTNTTAKVTIPGNIWNDIDGDAVIDAGENGLSNNMWVNLTDPNGVVIASVKVNANGTYQFDVSTADLSLSGNYTVKLTNSSNLKGDLLPVADTIGNGYEYTGTNRGTTGVNTANDLGVSSIGNLSTLTGGTTTLPVNFGVRLGQPLPVNLLSFTAVKNGSVVLLDWVTMAEQQNKGFVIEKSKDANSWSETGFVPSKVHGNSNTHQAYSFTDNRPYPGANFYRLRQIDMDGKVTYSFVRSVTMEEGQSTSIYPNPVNDYVNISGLKGGETIIIFNWVGQKVKEMIADALVVNLRTKDLVPGGYHVMVIDHSGAISKIKMLKL